MQTVRGVIDFDLQKIKTVIRQFWALGAEIGKAETPLPTGTSFLEGVSSQLPAKIL